MPDLRLKILPPAQQRVWHLLRDRAERLGQGGYYLAGGTALALHLGHRQSVDFDFFSQHPGPPESALAWLERLDGFTARDVDRQTVHGDVGGVKLSFIGGYRYPLLEEPLDAGGVRVARPLDVGVMKLLAVTHRATVRDYIDVAALVGAGWDLPALLRAGTRKYGPTFNPMVPLRALSAFGDLDGETPVMLDPVLARSWKDVLIGAVRRAAES